MTGSSCGRLKGKVALVTGIGSGIGQACAMMFASHGARVFGADIDAAAAERTLAQAREQGLEIEGVFPCDLTRKADVDRWVDASVQRHGPGIDILVNAAAWAAMVPIESMDYEQHWRRTLVFELDLVFLACQAVWPHLKVRGGSIINFASANAYQALEGSPALAHCAGKGGVLSMTRQLAMEGAPHGIRANTISPGLIETGATRDLPRVFKDAAIAKHMLKRIGQPNDVAWCATFLASDESAWVTAADFAVDGGATKW